MRALRKAKKSFSDEERKRLFTALEDNNYISSWVSSEAGDSDCEEEVRLKMLKTRPLSWRSDILNNAFKKLDRIALKLGKTKGAAPYMERTLGEPSHRPSPEDAHEWALKNMNI